MHFARPLLTKMGNLDDYEGARVDGHRKIDVVGTDSALGQHYRRGIVEYFGISNVDGFLRHVENAVNDPQDANLDGAFGDGVVDFVDLVKEACARARRRRRRVCSCARAIPGLVHSCAPISFGRLQL